MTSTSIASDIPARDTELLVLAERCGLRIHEVPVDWYDDPDSRVDVVSTALEDIRGVLRIWRTLRSDRLPIDTIRATMGRTMPSGHTSGQVLRFAAVGALTTLLHLGGFALLSTPVGMAPQAANLSALVLATAVNTTLNRRWTFGISGTDGAWWHQIQGLLLLALTWALTAGTLAGLLSAWPQVPTSVSTLAVGIATAAATVTKFAVMRRWRAGAGTGDLPRARETAAATQELKRD